MGELSAIFWFSGTGNSLYAAKRLAAVIKNTALVRITGEAAAGTAGGSGSAVGFVFPSYYGNLPRAVRAFVERIEIKPDTYVFAVVTKGGVGLGTVSALHAALKAKGVKLSFGRCVHMPANYVASYNPANVDKCEKAIIKAEKCLDKFAAMISARAQSVKKLKLTANNLYKNIEALDTAFSAGDGCSGCGLCERICPVRNIRMENGKPEWLHRCEHCMACISWCPVKAIEYGSRTQSRRRYRNPHIEAEELSEE
jgi:ferredoxin